MAKCPNCREPGAYVGAIFVECANSKCMWYTDKQRLMRAEEAYQSMELDLPMPTRQVSSDPDKTPVMWPLQFDFGLDDDKK